MEKGALGLLGAIVIGGLEVVAVGILLAIGFHIGAKIIEKVEKKKPLKLKKARA